MKRVMLGLCILVAGFTGSAQFTGATLQATGLTCAMCSNAINKALQAVPFVAAVKSDIPNSAFILSFKQGADVDIDALKTAVEDAGFSIGKLQMTGVFSGETVADGKHIRLGRHHFHFLDVKSQTLSGEKTITVIDRDYLTAKQFRKISSAHHSECVASGRSASCCTAEGFSEDARVYHVTI
jgi:copper chaperone CopZ